MELHQLRAFTQVVEDGSFREAAETLHLTQAAVSHSIKSLEGRVGVTLLNRGRTGVSLTEAGEVLLPYAKRVVETIGTASEDLASLHGAGTLKLATFASASNHYLPAVLQEFHSRFPRIRLDIKEGNDLDTLEWLRTGEVDVAFVVGHPRNVQFQPLYDDDFVLVARGDQMPGVAENAVPIEMVSDQRVIAATGGCEKVVSAALSVANTSVVYSAVVREPSTALALVQAGVGITILPRLLVPTLPRTLVCLDIIPRISRQISIAVRRGERRSHAVASFMGLVGQMRGIHGQE